VKLEFKQKHTEQLPLYNLETEQFINLAIKTSNQLGWVFGNKTGTGFTAYTNNGLFSWNAEVKMKIMNGYAILQSHSSGNDFIDVVENKRNIEDFISAFKRLQKTLSPAEPELIYENLEKSVA
jgi:rhomboid protease GluP